MPIAVITCRDYFYNKDGSPDYNRGEQTFISHGVNTDTMENVVTDNDLFTDARIAGRVVFTKDYGWVFSGSVVNAY